MRHEKKQHILEKTHPRLYVQEENGFSHLSDTMSTAVIQHRSVYNKHPSIPHIVTIPRLSHRWLFLRTEPIWSMSRADVDHGVLVMALSYSSSLFDFILDPKYQS
ncbi:hypothetical protein PAMP_024432 [Pampus punctatissimus]